MNFQMYLKERELESKQKGHTEGIESVALDILPIAKYRGFCYQ